MRETWPEPETQKKTELPERSVCNGQDFLGYGWLEDISCEYFDSK